MTKPDLLNSTIFKKKQLSHILNNNGFIHLIVYYLLISIIPISEVKSLSRVQLFATPWSVAHQPPPSMEFSRQEYWSGLPFPFPRDLPNLGIEPGSPTLWADAFPSEPPGNPSVMKRSEPPGNPSVMKRTSIFGVSSRRACTSS